MGLSIEDLIKNVKAANPLDAFYMALNVLSSIFIVFTNKWVYETYRFNYPTTLTLIHFLVTFLGLHMCSLVGMFQVKKLEIIKIVPLSLSFCGFVVLTNISLKYNSVGFYQIAKVMTTPVVMTIQYYVYHIRAENKIKMTLVPIIIGVSIATVTDFKLNAIGFIYAVLGVIVTSFYQVWVGTKQKELQVSSMQLLYYQAPLSAFMLLFVIPFLDNVRTGPDSLWHYKYSNMATFMILLSGFIAFLVNLSIFLVIGRTSPVTYNVLGHFKLTTIILGGFFLFGAPVDWRNIAGILLTLTGVFAYTHFKLEGERLSKEAAAANEAQQNALNKLEVLLKKADDDTDSVAASSSNAAFHNVDLRKKAST
mmetsp:Transcript_13971/g.23091  ORF Transcript_13971/g.23091 Transcript_13971/m.23091 type:complete len:365 (+) Transcript_13971:193-1287(+)|eukprot:CAMPEP_0184675630 /NCGR_PEP_ID=MMETSP0308-20130426/87889_1 /TAXON_ID=38269 /ORGANISM="Gloeochaete witrockiana, Strain SAG 46.84" /LENGTH=364 /DNA_ID=CAMNT_0027123351 /DNA_START=130 /DNA_END=1224 /DNA_ORIENTATION=-